MSVSSTALEDVSHREAAVRCYYSEVGKLTIHTFAKAAILSVKSRKKLLFEKKAEKAKICVE